MEHSRPVLLSASAAALVFVASALFFLPAIGYGFHAGDDEYNFVFNERWMGFTRENLRWMWLKSYYGHYQPLTWMSFALEHLFTRTADTRVMHATNVGLHALNTALVYLLIRRTWAALPGDRAAGNGLARALAAAAGALCFGIHPLRVESVVWLTERRDLLSCGFLIAAVLAYLRRAQGGGARWTVASLAFFFLSLASKAWGITLPAVLLVLDWYPLRRLSRRSALRLAVAKWPYALLASLFAALAVWAQASIEALRPWSEHGFLQRLAQAAYGLVFYVWKTLLPLDLSHMYLLEQHLDPFDPLYAGALLLVLLATALLVRFRGAFPAGLAAWASYAILVSPVLGLAQSGWQKVADRYAYVAAIPFALLAAAGCVAGARSRRAAAGTALAALAALSGLGAATWRQVRIWSDSRILWARVVELDPENYLGQHNLSVALYREGRYAEALEHELLALRFHPERSKEVIYDHLGLLYAKQGDWERARAAWKAGIALEPMEHTVHLFAEELMSRGLAREAEAMLRGVAERRPAYLWAHNELADLYLKQDKQTEALAQVRVGLAENPTWARGNFYAGSILLEQGRPGEAEPFLRRAAALSPSADYHSQLASCLIELGRRAEAVSQLRRALALDPDHEHARMLIKALGAEGE